MLTAVHPKLPMSNKQATLRFYKQLGFQVLGGDFDAYLMVQKDNVELHFFSFPDINPLENYGQIYIRVNQIQEWYNEVQQKGIAIHSNAPLQIKPWGQVEFSILDPDNNLITFGEAVC